MYGKGSLMSPFAFFSSISRKPILRWLLIATLLAGLFIVASRAWSAPATIASKSTAMSTKTVHATTRVAAATESIIVLTEKVTPDTPIAKVEKASPALNLSAVPDNFTVTQGAGGASTISITGPAASAAKLSEKGLPEGITAICTPVDASGRSTVIVSASKTAPTGPVQMTVSAGDGSSTVVTINVIHDNDPDFAPAVLPGRVVVSPGSDNSCAVSLTPTNGFSSPVALSLSGVPVGVTAEFEPSTTSTTSTLHIVATPKAAVAGTPIPLVATSNGITHTARVMLSVEARPDFGLSAWTERVKMAAGSMGAGTINIDSHNGFAAPVALEVSGLPKGITGHFSPALVKTGTSTLLLTSDGTAPVGSSTIVITARSAGLVHKRTIGVDIDGDNRPSFVLTAWPADLTVHSGSRAANTVRIVRSNGFDDLVALSITGLPKGVTAEFSPASTRGSSTLTISADNGVALTSPIAATVTGVAGGVTQTVNMNLTIGSAQQASAPGPVSKAF